jgi:spermidine/putrescine transport system substrate-binding protein
MVIQKGAPRPDLAHQFMNFMLEGKNSAELTNLIGSGNPNMEAIKFIKPELLKNPAIFPDKAVQAKLEQLKDLTTARLRNKLWTVRRRDESWCVADGTWR